MPEVDYQSLRPHDASEWRLHGIGQQAMRISALAGVGPDAFGRARSRPLHSSTTRSFIIVGEGR